MTNANHARPLHFMAALVILLLSSRAGAGQTDGRAKVCIAHAGASGHAPEHTAAAYRLAVEMKADYIEQDLQLTKDAVLVCIHDATLERTTNVKDVFPDRYRVIKDHGKERKVWPVVDFTLDEVKRLDAGSWFDPKFKDQRVVTFEESIEIARGKAGIYPELKKSEFAAKDGPNIVAVLHRVLVARGLNTKQGQKHTPLVVQCFYPEMLKELRQMSGDAYPLVQLVWLTQVDGLLSDDGLSAVSKYADGIGPTGSMLLSDTSRVAAAQQRGLLVHAWSLDEKVPDRFADLKSYQEFLLYDLGVDGIFSGRPDQFPRH